jgi:CCR4-NOT transcription complex subunit 6
MLHTWKNTVEMEPIHDDCRVLESTYRIVSLNCLAPSYVNPHQISWVHPMHLTWSHRKKSLIESIRELRPDIVCLQEFEEDPGFLMELAKAGFSTIFHKRPGRLDGCATCWMADKFRIVGDFKVVDFNDLASERDSKSLNYKRDNIAVICRLRDLNNSRFVVVGNTHLYWNPMRPEIKLAQIVYFVRHLEIIVSSSQDGYLLCGDLNSTPGSRVLEFLERGKVIPPPPPNPDRFLCDTSLSRLCRWLRILGIDTEMETQLELQRRTWVFQFVDSS